MRLIKITTVIFCVLTTSFLSAQEVTGIQAEMRSMAKETDPLKSDSLRKQIIKDHALDKIRDAETIDMLHGNVAIAYAMQKNYKAFEQNIGLIRNKFNQTSMMSMAADKLLEENIDAEYAAKIARQTLDKYDAYKNDPEAKPKDMAQEDWDRFMNYAKYPYYDTYAKSLFALKKYDEALKYQRLAFDGKPEEGFPPSVERYAMLLELAGDANAAKEFLLKIAGMGKLNKGMIAQLQSLYDAERGKEANFDFYLDSLQNGIQAAMQTALRKEMLDETAPDFTLKDINGNTVRLADHKGKVVILDLWATWCVPCIASFPAMQKQVLKHPDVVFLFIAVQERGNDPLEKVKKFIRKNNYTFQVLMDERIDKTSNEFKILSSYRPDGIPAKYFIDKGGKLRFRSAGFDTDSELINEIDAMIAILNGL